MFGRFSILNFDITAPSVFDKASGGAIDTSQQAGLRVRPRHHA